MSWVVERLRERWPEELEVTTAPEGDEREAALLRVDSSKAREQLGWEPVGTSPLASTLPLSGTQGTADAQTRGP